MQLRRDSRVVRWAYLWESSVPYRTSLCAIFWRTVLWTPLKMIAPLGILSFCLRMAWLYPLDWAIGTGVFIGIVLAVGCIAWVQYRFEHRDVWADKKPSVLRDGFRAVKSKVCPIVDLL